MASTAYNQSSKIRPRPVKGFWQNLRKTSLITLLSIFTFLPLINWQNRQAIWFDLADRRFYIFDITIYPQDFVLLTFVLMGLAITLFVMTAIFGRIWCGYSCPHTVYTELFLFIEQKVEGNRSEQLRIERLSWKNSEKIIKRGMKYLLWLTIALITGMAFVGYFYPIRQLVPDFLTGNLPFTGYLWVFLYGGFTYLQAGIVRENFCKYVCPYARFQGAMFDLNTLVISYDHKRGEPRRRLKKQDRENKQDLGFCVDCSMCVQVCPTGIDIRKGLQLECIACAACIDACNNTMDQIGAPRGLIRYTSTNALEQQIKTKFIRPKTITYALMWFITAGLLFYTLTHKSTVELTILRDRNILSRQIGNNIQNSYTIKVLNKSNKTHTFTISATGIAQLKITNNKPITVNPGELYERIITIQAPKQELTQLSSDITIFAIAKDDEKQKARQKTIFLRPLKVK